MRNVLLSTTAAAALLLGGAVAQAQSDKSPSSNHPPAAAQQQSQPSSQRGEHGRSMQHRGAGDERAKRNGRSQDQNTGKADNGMGQSGAAAANEDAGSNRSQARERNDNTKRGEARDRNRGEAKKGQRARSDAKDQKRNRDQAKDKDRNRNRTQARDRNSQKGGEARERTQREDRNQGQRSSAQQNRQSDRDNVGQSDRSTFGGTDSSRRDRSDRQRDRAGRAGESRRDRGSMTLSSNERTRVRDVISRQRTRSVTNVNFSVNVGTVVPSRVHLHSLPSTIVSIVPQYRGYKYIVVRDEIVIVHPRTHKIVTVISDSDTATGSRSSSSTRMSFSPEQRRVIRRYATRRWEDRPSDFSISIGATLPRSAELYAFPDTVYAEVPELRSYRYVVVDDEVLLVDPDGYRIVQVIED